MKKQLIAVGLASLLAIPAVSFSAEMGGAGLYGSFRTGLSFGAGDASVSDFTSRWGFKGSHEVAEGLTASYKYESKFNTTNAESSGGVGHSHAAFDKSTVIVLGQEEATSDIDHDMDPGTTAQTGYTCTRGNPLQIMRVSDTDDTITGYTEIGAEDSFATALEGDNVVCGNIISDSSSGSDANGGPGGRLSYVALSGGFGTITLGQIWSASAIHYGFAIDPSYVNGVFGGANYRNGNSVSYSSSAGDVSFQIDKVTGDAEKVEFGGSANLGPVGIGFANWSNADDDAGFTGVAVSAGAAGVNLTVGLGSEKDADGDKSKMNVLHVGGSLGDSGLSYAVQVANSDADGGAGDQTLVVVTNSLGSGASLIFEHVSYGDDTEAASLLGLKVDF